ncbi:MAG: cyclic nucleotide-binding domain-containing protein, partial [Campylobacteraceae bacterium]|nr:cyclic nucleotide-binding domain-containing protein [Campylobacteraceae bacterium]
QEFSSFLSRIHPFDTLSRGELEVLSKSLSIKIIKKNECIQDQGDTPTHLYFVKEGLIQETSDGDVVSVYSNHEFFDPISLIENYSKNSFSAIEESICCVLDRNVFIELLHDHKDLERYFFQSISKKLNTSIINHKNTNLTNIMLAKVKDSHVHKAIITTYNTSIYEAVSLIKKEEVPTLLLTNENDELFIVTDSDFREKVILNKMSFDENVGRISSGNLIYINENEFLFHAYLLMTKHSVKRLVVKNNEDKIIGIIDQISLARFFATQTFSVSNEIEKAQSLDELKNSSHSLLNIIKSLHEKGVKTTFISKLVNQLNRKIIDKVIKLTAPKELLGNYCFIVMGSEGRGEQIIKTDQDNALIINDKCQLNEKILSIYTHDLTEILVDFGFPRCDGNIMVSNSYWCRKNADFKKQIFEWVSHKTGEDFMNIAIFYDALCASGDITLLNELKSYLFEICSKSQSFYTNFSKIIMDFDIPLGFFNGFIYAKDKDHKNEIDIKKGGIFILVQSIRSLSLEHKIFRTNTIKRIIELEKIGVLEKEFAEEIKEAFNFLNVIKLNAHLNDINLGREVNNFISPKNLSSMEKDLLKDSFKIINKLKKKLELRYRLNYV